MDKIAIALISFYQKTLSPDHGLLRGYFPFGACRFEETCSQYAVRQIKERGFMLSILPLTKRLLSCQPWFHLKPAHYPLIKDHAH